jgi:zinc D-Ala-D-Ala carboxypeptidase
MTPSRPDDVVLPATRRSSRAGDRHRRRGGRVRTVVAAVTSVLLVAAVAVTAVAVRDARRTAAQQAATLAERTAAASLAAQVADADADVAAAQARAARQDASDRVRAGIAAAQAAAEAAAAEAARLAEEQAAAEAEAASAAASTGTSTGSSGIAGWVDGRPVDADGNILWVTSVPTADGDGSNGNMPASAMCRIEWGTDQLGFAQYLRCDAADALTALNEAFTARFGSSIDLDLTYRSYADQVAMKAAFGGLAATPGTSSHGTGTALDVQEWATYAFGSERYTWLVENGPTYGWYAPARVREGQPYAEYWHFEYEPGRTS